MLANPPRVAALDDAPAIVALVNAAFAIEKAFVDGERTSLDEIQDLLRKGLFLIAENDERQPIACAYIEQRGYRAYLGMLSIDPANQGRGLGRDMMAAAEDFCRGRRVRSMDIKILSLRPELPPFYRKLGYAEDGVEPYENPKAMQAGHFIRMSKNL